MKVQRVAAVGVAAVMLLSGCSVVQRTAIRLNEDGTLDFGSCEVLSNVSAVTANYAAESGDQFPIAVDEPPTSINEGTVIHLGAPPMAVRWDSVSVYVSDDSEQFALSGDSYREDLTVGEWRWAQSGIFIGTVDVTVCDLDD
jgi:hypothetical protein